MKIIFFISILFFLSHQFFSKQNQQPALKHPLNSGQKVYTGYLYCLSPGRWLGVQRMNPPLVKTKWVLGDKKALAKIVLNGLKGGEIEIDGDDFHNPMPPQAGQLTDQQIADALTYVRNSFGNKASAVTVADVKAARGATQLLQQSPAAKKPAAKTPC